MKYEQKSNVIKCLLALAVNGKAIGKTDRCIITRSNEHAVREDQPLHQHSNSLSEFNYLVQLLENPGINSQSFPKYLRQTPSFHVK